MLITDIKLNKENPRVIKDDKFKKLCDSIEKFPQMMELRPIVVDEDNVILGGNMRYTALKHLNYKELPDSWIKKASDLTEAQKQEFIIKDNVGFGEWEWEMLANQYDKNDLIEWGLDIPELGLDIGYGEDFSLPDGDKEPFQQITFTLSDEQAKLIKQAIEDIKKTDSYRYIETFGNQNSNGNALYCLIQGCKIV